MPLFEKFNPGDITISHHYTGDRFRLHSFKHRGYWFHGRNRESATVGAFQRLVGEGGVVVEVGGRIGYFSVLFSALVGRQGVVVVFEPGANNLEYLRRNVAERPNICLIEKAAGAVRETRPFFVEDLSGQNNSLVRGFRGFEANRASAFVKMAPKEVLVEVVPVDEVVSARHLRPSFVKIDVEGAEFEVLQGLAGTLDSCRPRLMVEIQADQEKIFNWLGERGFRCFSERGAPVAEWRSLDLNTFVLHESDVAGLRLLEGCQ